jgi:hypothetical protein
MPFQLFSHIIGNGRPSIIYLFTTMDGK